MTSRRDTFRMLAVIGVRSIGAHKVKSLIVGSLVFFGTLLVVVGLSFLDSVEASMARSVTSSLSGHLQIYDSGAKDDLALFGSGFMAQDDIGKIDDFAPVKAAIEAVPNVRAVVPMGIGMATVSNPGELDLAIEELRAAVYEHDDPKRTAAAKAKVKRLADELHEDYTRRAKISTDVERMTEGLRALDDARGEALWDTFDAAPEVVLQALDTKVAPLGDDAQLEYVRYLGTDLDAFAKHFDRMRVVSGEPVPSGRRGILLSERFYEKRLKHKVARDLDRIRDKLAEEATIAGDPMLEAIAKALPSQYQRVTLQLDPDEAAAAEAALRKRLPEVEGGLPDLVRALLTVDDATFHERFAWFYEDVAPKLQLHRVEPGEILTLRSFTRGGYLKSVNLKVWGVFRFEGLEASDIAGAQNLVDMVSFRELQGVMTEENLGELKAIREKVGVEAVEREDAESALFGGDEALVEDDSGAAAGFDEFEKADLAGQVARLREAAAEGFDPAQIDRGLALNAAVVLEDPERLDETKKAIEEVVARDGLRLQVTDWQTASGMIGQFIAVVRYVLYLAIVIIFLVALVIINNSMVLATMERVQEIGTLRAIGAERWVVLVMFLVETLVLGVGSGLLGAAAGAALLGWLGATGVSSGGVDILVFLFSGPKLYPALAPLHLLVGLVAVVLVSLASTLYPAAIATRIQPVVAMQRGGD